MKQTLFLSVFMLNVLTVSGQSIESRISYVEDLPTAYHNQAYTLAVGKTTSTEAMRNANKYPYEKKEFEWAVRYATLYADELQQYDQEYTYDYIRDAIDNFTRYGYTSTLPVNLQILPKDYSEIRSISDYKKLGHCKLLQNETFRKFAIGVAKRMLKEFVGFYPRDYKKYLLKQIDYAIDFMNDIHNHQYNVKWMDGDYGYGWIELYDGDEVSYTSSGIEGIILRRMLLNDIPLNELMSIAKDIREAVSETDNSANPDVMMRISLNDDLVYCIGCEDPYFISNIPHEEYISDSKRKVYSKYQPFELDFASRMNGWGCSYEIEITAVEHYNETTYFHNAEGELISQKNDLYLYAFTPPQYGFGHCFVENNVTRLEIDGMFRIHRKLY